MQGFAEFRVNPILCPVTARFDALGACAARIAFAAKQTTKPGARWIQEHPAWI